METFLWLAGGFCLFILIKYIYDNYLLEQNLANEGGIQIKYKSLVSFLSSGPKENVKIKDFKNYLEIKVSTPNILTITTLTPGFDCIEVKVEMDYRTMGKIERKWQFDTKKYTQDNMVAVIKADIIAAQNELIKSNNLHSQHSKLSGQKSVLNDLNSLMGENGTDGDIIQEGIGQFGLEITNPIPVEGIEGSYRYLAQLRTLENEEITFERYGSDSSPNIKGMIDVYLIYNKGVEIAKLYIAPYNKKNSSLAPIGFKLAGVNDDLNNNFPDESIKKTLKINDYLLESSIDRTLLSQDELGFYRELMTDKNLDEGMQESKEIVTKFYYKYKISLIKIKFNKEYFETPVRQIPSIYHKENAFVAPSLIKLGSSLKLKIIVFPDWFYHGFPDVIRWAIGEGDAIAKPIISKYTFEEFEDPSLKYKILTLIIDKYLESHDYLECGINYK